MDPLTWTGSLAFLNMIFAIALVAMAAALVIWMLLSILTAGTRHVANADGTMTLAGNPQAIAGLGVKFSCLLVAALALAYVVLGLILGSDAGILGAISRQLLPTWVALLLLFGLSVSFKRRLGLYGKLFDSPIGMIGFALVMFWVFTGLFGALDLIATHDPLGQISGMKNKVPGTPVRGADEGDYAWYLLGGDNLARDVFSRVVKGAGEVLKYAPLATLFAFMVGITLGLPAGYYGGRLDTALSFIANLILAFPVILLFYLLVTPEIVATGLPQFMAVVLFAFPLVFCAVLIHSRFRTQPGKNRIWLAVVLLPIFLTYMSLINSAGSKIDFWPLDFFEVPGGVLVVFVSVVFVNSPTVFRIVRGLAMDIKTRDYVAAAQTRGERPWYIMLWEILPNVRGPLIVDFCLRIGYTTILLGTLGFFGLGLPPESPDWGSTINDGRKLLRIYLHPALPPAVALMSLVLGLNLLADGLREESLKD
ncbi:ABC transporter permease [Tritonibacter horizontis]|uniref:Glutathione transport system permease protein GsiD n=1 Tax=Tritonibacter horizontis TaxID=1768241 RepID=A0A132BVU7_9RHOB|nr:ABC transporter permease [Tritonibacter horizontis]KUP92493.1 glutathione transport system permease protein GsiD [Tritonibacter horizontis]